MGVKVAQALRAARDLMNTNGRHWTKGDMRFEVTGSMLERRDTFYLHPKTQEGDTVFCTWGGIAEVVDDNEIRVEAMEALVRVIEPDSYKSYIENWKYNYNESLDCEGDYFIEDYPTFEMYFADCLNSREDELGDIIAGWNDDEQRTWEDVKTSLTIAAEKAKRRK